MARDRPRIMVALAQCDGPDDVLRLHRAGADEFYAGLLPAAWRRRWGFEASANRRTAPHQHVLDLAHLRRLAAAIRDLCGRLFVAFNPLAFSPAQLRALRPIVDAVERVEPDGYILSDVSTALAFRSWGVARPLVASVSMGLINVPALALGRRLGFRRAILPPKLTVAETARLCRAAARRRLGMEFEAFAAGAGCVFGSDTCYTLHGYGLRPYCRSRPPCSLRRIGPPGPRKAHAARRAVAVPPPLLRCSLCAVPALARLPGVRTFKVPGRGRDEGDPVRNVRLLRAVLDGRIGPADLRAEVGCRGGGLVEPRCYYAVPAGSGGR
jgi:collagenase-like PrtC family protease